MDVFFSDLDNTLIYSHSRNIKGDKVAVEFLNGKEQSYMTKYTYEYLKGASWLNLVPVTTRTEKQFNRLKYIKEININYVIVNNGGKLLVDGNEDKSWSNETFKIVENQLEDLEQAIEILNKLVPDNVLHRPELYMCYAKVESPWRLYEELSKKMKSKNVDIQYDRRKIYLFASRVNKGNAIKRFLMKVSVETAVAAGDDIMDISMLNEVVYALAAERISENVIASNKVVIKGNVISDKICEEVQKLHLAGKL